MYSLLKKILSDNTKHKMFRSYTSLVRKKLTDAEKKIPKIKLEEKHIANLKALTDREKLLQLLPKNGVVAELGVNRGDFSRQILKNCEPSRLHLVDIWNTERYHGGLELEVEKKFATEIASGTIEINKGLSTAVVNQYPEAYFDWIYIDTAHSYEVTKMELEMYASKIKTGGLICGHDYMMGNWAGMVRYGVIEAVHEFCRKEDWEIVYLTMDIEEYQSFAIRKIIE